MLSGFLARYSPAKAMALTALLFAVFHPSPMAFAQALARGYFYAWMVRRTGSLLPAMAAHAVNNGVVTTMAILSAK